MQTHRFLPKMSSLNLVCNEMFWWYSVDDVHIFFKPYVLFLSVKHTKTHNIEHLPVKIRRKINRKEYSNKKGVNAACSGS